MPPAGMWASLADARSGPFHFRAIEVEIARRLARDLDAALVATLDVSSASALIDAMCAPAFVRPAWPRDR